MDLSNQAGKATASDLLPAGTLAFAVINYREEKQGANGPWHDLELTIDAGQQFAGRKLWHKMMDPERHSSEKAREWSANSLARILECMGASPQNPSGYQIQHVSQIRGARVGIEIGIEKGTDGYADKNKVSTWLTPNPDSAAKAKWDQLVRVGQQAQSAVPGVAPAPVAAAPLAVAPMAAGPQMAAPLAAAPQMATAPLAVALAGAPAPAVAPTAPAVAPTAPGAVAPSWATQAEVSTPALTVPRPPF